MNKKLHRIIFNASRGCRMAVAETARTCSKAASGATAAVTTLALPGLLAALSSQAQIIADPSAPGSQRPVILNTANGLPQVNIQTPSAAGVSRNTYSQFDVQAQGAILNNSAASVQTQLGGWISGNPMVSGGAARVILNEVNSSNPSLLKGYVEVAGSKAEVIIANPSGIQVNGGGFINASTVTLTTGTPVMNGGNLESYQVTGGRIQIEGLGLDTRTASATQILTRAAEINAGLWANHLKLVLGANQVNAADPTGETTGSSPVPIAAKAGEAKPRFALDVASIGGMYAGHIYLTGTEKGLGVNTQGSLQANSGDLVLHANGWLTNDATIQASGNISITASGSSNSTRSGSVDDGVGAVTAHGVPNSGSIYAGGNLTLKVEGEVNNSGTAALLAAGGDSTVHAGRIANSGTAAAGVQADGTLGNTGTLNLSAAEVDNSASGELVAVDTRITATDTFTNRGLVDGANTRIDAATLRNVGTGRIYGDTVSLSATSLSNEAETLAAPSGQSTKAAVIAARERLDIGAGTLTNGYADGQSALIYSGGDMVFGGSLDANRRATGSAQSISNAGGTIAAMGNLAASAARISNTNPDFAYDIISAGSKADREYIAASGQLYTQEQIAWLLHTNFGSAGGGGGYAYGGAQGRFLPVGHVYADTKYQPYYGSGNAFVAAHTTNSTDFEGNTTSTYVGDSFAYGAGDAIWSVFGVAPPAGGNPGSRPYAYCNDFGCYNPTSSELAAWEAAAAPWMNLQARLDAFRSSVNNSAVTYVTFRELSRDVPQAIVTASTPGKISAAGDLTLNASDSLLNEQSQIVAGGLLKVTAAAINNQAKTIDTSAARSGTQYTWDGNFDYGCGGKNCVRYSAYRPYNYSDAVPLSLSLNTASVSTSQGSGVNQGIIQIPAAAGSSGGSDGGNTVIRSADPGNGLNTAPGSSLFQPAAGSNASYLLETDPRFTQYKTWLGSDYMTAALGYDPATTQKRLGDGFYEQLLVREQVAQLTGRRFLSDYSSDEQQYRALMNAGITYAQTYNLRPGVALSAEQMAMLTSDIVWLVEKEVTLLDGSTQKALVPQLYARVQEGDLTAGGALLGGADVQIDAASVLNSGSIQGRRVVSLNAQTVANLGGDIRAQNTGISTAGDIHNIGGRIGAEQNLQLLAGGSINVASTSATTEGSGTGQASRTDLTRIAGLYVSGAGGTLVANAGQDINLVAGVVQSAGNANLSAAGNINLQTAETNRIYQAGGVNASVEDSNRSEVGSQVSAGGGLSISAGKDITARAADISAAGNTTLGAGNNIILAAGEQSASYDYASRSSTSGWFNTTTTEERSTASLSQALATNLGGKNITLQSGVNTIVKGSNVIADENVTIKAEGGVNIEAAQNTASSSYSRTKSESGLLSGGGLGITIGSRNQSADQKNTQSTAAASTVGAINGNATITAGLDYTQIGSDVLTPKGDVGITAQAVSIREARETGSFSSVQRFEQSGLTVGVGGGIIDTLQATAQAVQGVAYGSGNRNKALNALVAYAKGADLMEQGQAVANAYQKNGVMGSTGADGKANPGAAAASGIKVSISLGTSSSESNSNTETNSSARSTVKAGGDVNIRATDADLTLQGSSVAAGRNVNLQAAQDINLVASADLETNRSSNSSSSTSVGVSFGVGAGGAGLSVDIAASRGRGQANSDSTTWNNSYVSAGQQASLSSGADTNIIGGNLTAKQVTVDVGSNLNIESLQDKAVSSASQSNTGMALSIPVMGAGGSASLSMAEQRSNSNYASVNEQSGIKAGEGGFTINVQGNTDLKGATIVGSSDASKNTLSTNTLTTSDISNSMSASASSSGVSVGTNMLEGKYALGKALAGNAMNSGSASQSDASTTTSAISAGTISVGAKTTDTSKDTLTDSSGKTVSTDTGNTNRTLARADVAGLQQQAQQNQADNMLVLKAATAFTDEAYRTMYKAGAQMYLVPPGCSEKSCAVPLSEQDASALKTSQDGKVHISNNGIFNDLDGAVKYAQNHGGTINADGSKNYSDKPENQYIIFAPQSNNVLSELIIAGVQKSGLTPTIGLTNAEEQTAKIVQQANQQGQSLVIDSHSRGTLTTDNALQSINNQGGIKDDAGNTLKPNIQMNNYGGAQNVQTGNRTLQQVTGNGDAMINSVVHVNDSIGTMIGGNQATPTYTSVEADGTKTLATAIPNDKSPISNATNIMMGTATPHNCYGTSGGTAGCGDVWNKPPVSNLEKIEINPDFKSSVVIPQYQSVDKGTLQVQINSDAHMSQLLQPTQPMPLPPPSASTPVNTKLERLQDFKREE